MPMNTPNPETVRFPAVVISDRIRDDGTVFVARCNDRPIHTPDQLADFMTYLVHLQTAGGAHYNYTVAALDEADGVIAQIRAERQGQAAELNRPADPCPLCHHPFRAIHPVIIGDDGIRYHADCYEAEPVPPELALPAGAPLPF